MGFPFSTVGAAGSDASPLVYLDQVVGASKGGVQCEGSRDEDLAAVRVRVGADDRGPADHLPPGSQSLGNGGSGGGLGVED